MINTFTLLLCPYTLDKQYTLGQAGKGLSYLIEARDEGQGSSCIPPNQSPERLVEGRDRRQRVCAEDHWMVREPQSGSADDEHIEHEGEHGLGL